LFTQFFDLQNFGNSDPLREFYNLDELINQINGLNGEEIDAKTVGGKFSIDAFMQSALSVDMNKDLGSIKDFENHPFVSHFIKILNPSGLALLPIMIPGLGDLLDIIDVQLSVGPSIKWFRSFCEALLEHHGGKSGRSKSGRSKSGRSKDFLNIFATNKISEAEANTATMVLPKLGPTGGAYKDGPEHA